jgi:hypothetical protein
MKLRTPEKLPSQGGPKIGTSGSIIPTILIFDEDATHPDWV